jgi:hypothetical protein
MRTRNGEEISELIDGPHLELRARHGRWSDGGNDVAIDGCPGLGFEPAQTFV